MSIIKNLRELWFGRKPDGSPSLANAYVVSSVHPAAFIGFIGGSTMVSVDVTDYIMPYTTAYAPNPEECITCPECGHRFEPSVDDWNDDE